MAGSSPAMTGGFGVPPFRAGPVGRAIWSRLVARPVVTA